MHADSGQSPYAPIVATASASRRLVEPALLLDEIGLLLAFARPAVAAAGAPLPSPRRSWARISSRSWSASSWRRVRARLGVGLERFPDHRRLRIVGRPAVEHALAAAPVDPHHAHAGRGEERPPGPLVAGFLDELLEDRRRDAPALGLAAEAARLVVADVDPADDVGRAADEPHVGRAGGGAGLAEQRHARGRAARSRCRAGPRLRACARPGRRCARPSPACRCSRSRGIGLPSHSAMLQPVHSRVVGAPDHLAAAVLHVVDQRRRVLQRRG